MNLEALPTPARPKGRGLYFVAVALELGTSTLLLLLLMHVGVIRPGVLGKLSWLVLIGAAVHFSPLGRWTDRLDRQRRGR